MGEMKKKEETKRESSWKEDWGSLHSPPATILNWTAEKEGRLLQKSIHFSVFPSIPLNIVIQFFHVHPIISFLATRKVGSRRSRGGASDMPVHSSPTLIRPSLLLLVCFPGQFNINQPFQLKSRRRRSIDGAFGRAPSESLSHFR